MEFLHPAMWHDHDFDFSMTCTLHCGMCAPRELPSHAIQKGPVELMLSSDWHVRIYSRLNSPGPNVGFWGSPGDTAPKRGDFLPGTNMYHHAKFHTDRYRRRRHICLRTKNLPQT